MAKITSIGGQALIEGIMMRGPHKTAAAFVGKDGTVTTETYDDLVPLLKRHKWLNIPILRGTFALVDSLTTGMRMLNRSADKYLDGEEEQPGKVEAWLTAHFGRRVGDVLTWFAMAVGIVLAVGLFIFLPSLLFNGVNALTGNVLAPWRSVFEGLLRVAIFLAYVCLCTLLKDVRRTFEFHGAEHKTIFCYEHELPLTVENVRAQRRFHPRCGTSFLMLSLLVGIVVGLFIPFSNPWLRGGVKLLLIPVTMGIGYELIRWCGRHDNWLTHIVAQPGLWVQRLTVKEPDDKMMEAAIAAMKLVIPENGEDLL